MGKRKKGLVEKINKILGVNLELKRIPLAELEKLHDAISTKIGGEAEGVPAAAGRELQGLMDVPLAQILRRKLEREHKRLEDLTVRDLLSVVQEGTGRGGILGLGILPALLGRRK